MNNITVSIKTFLNGNLLNGFFWSVIVGFLLARIYDEFKHPKLEIEMAELEAGKNEGTRKRYQQLRVRVKNLGRTNFVLPERSVAVDCLAELIFLDNGGHEIHRIKGRWVETPTPTPNAFLAKQRIDIPPGSSELLDVGRKYEGEEGFYPISNESFQFGPDLKNPKWKIRNSELRLRIEVSYGERISKKEFRISNKTTKVEDFELIEID